MQTPRSMRAGRAPAFDWWGAWPARVRLGVVVLTWMLVGGAAAATAAAAAAATVSTNWAGYVALPAASSGFSSVSGIWKEPAAQCTSGHETYSAVWVGLGGYSERARSLEQAGTDANCSSSGRATYDAWYELLPAGPVNVRLAAHPGNVIAASVTVGGRHATLRIRNLSTGARFSKTVALSARDVSSAEWIVEAPSACFGNGNCHTLPLTDFGETAFSIATATTNGHTGTVSDPAWSATALELRQHGAIEAALGSDERLHPVASDVAATPSAVSASDGAFSVRWNEQTVHFEEPSGPTLPARPSIAEGSEGPSA